MFKECLQVMIDRLYSHTNHLNRISTITDHNVFLSGHTVIQNIRNTLNERTRLLIGLLVPAGLSLIVLIVVCISCCILRKRSESMYQVIHLWRFRLLLSFYHNREAAKDHKGTVYNIIIVIIHVPVVLSVVYTCVYIICLFSHNRYYSTSQSFGRYCV